MQDVTLSQEFVDEAIKRGMMKAPRKPSKAPQTAGVGFGTAQAPKLSPAAPLRAENWDNDSVFDFARKNFDQSERLDFYLKAIRDCPLGHRHNLLYGVVLRTPWAWGKAKSVVTAAIVQAAIDGGWDESEAERVVSDAMAVVDAEADLPVAQRRWKQWAALFPTLKFDIRTQELWAPDYTPDTDYLRYQNTAEYGSSLKDAEFVKELMQWAKNERGFDPLLDAFHKITQDCEMSVDEALRAFDELAELLNADDKERVSRLLQIWFIGSVNRILNPGAIFQRMLVLTGAGGIGKSAFFSIFDLGNGSAEAEHFDGNGFDSSELAEFNRHTFAVIDEMDKITGKYAQAALKGFITRCIDSYRLRWKAQAINVPRGYVLGGTVNGDAPLNDDGAELRRYLPILVTGEGAVIGKKRAAWYLANKTRIWQAAYTLFQAGFDSELSDEEIVREAEIVQNFVTRSGSFSKLAVLVGKINANNELLGRKSGPGFLLNDLIEFANNRPSHRPPSRTEILDAAKALKLRGWKAKDVTIDGIRHSSVWAPSHYTKVLGIGTAQDVSQLITMSNFEPRG
jgi:hypothetical protein